jgi:hypothetical protein
MEIVERIEIVIRLSVFVGGTDGRRTASSIILHVGSSR